MKLGNLGAAHNNMGIESGEEMGFESPDFCCHTFGDHDGGRSPYQGCRGIDDDECDPFVAKSDGRRARDGHGTGTRGDSNCRIQADQRSRRLLCGTAAVLGCILFLTFLALAPDDDGYSHGVSMKPSSVSVSAPPPRVTKVGAGGDNEAGRFRVSDRAYEEFLAWSKELHRTTEMDVYRGEPEVNWDWHPKERSDRFPSVQQRVEYYMGKWYDSAVPMHGLEFQKKVYELQRTTRSFGLSSSYAVNLYGLSADALKQCDKTEKNVLHTYCRDFVDFAILHSGGTANAIQHVGDSLPKASPNMDKVKDYPVLNKVRHFCPPDGGGDDDHDINPSCEGEGSVSTILWPLNRMRHFSPAARVSDIDMSWDEKLPRAVWRGSTCDSFGVARIFQEKSKKWALVSQHVNSSLVDAKFVRRKGDKADKKKETVIPENCFGPFVDQTEQLRNKYLISIEGNDVSSGLKWMLFSNSVVLLPPITYESWAMEGLLQPFVHYIPLKPDMSNVEEMIRWAESNPVEAKKIAERSTLFIYDLLLHPDALRDEQLILRGMVEKFEENFGSSTVALRRHPLSHIHADWHPKRREDRFPSVEERTKHYMASWFEGDHRVSMSPRKAEPRKLSVKLRKKGGIRLDEEFIAEGESLAKCAAGESGFGDEVRHYCGDAIPFFDERITYDLLGTKLPPADDDSFHLAPVTKDMSAKEKAWFKRILIDDSLKVLRFGNSPSKRTDIPVFTKIRESGPNDRKNPKSGPVGTSIMWQFDSDREYALVKSGLIERLDVPFKSKAPRAAAHRGGFGSNAPPEEGSSIFKYRNVQVLPPIAEPGEQNEREAHIRQMLAHRYIVASEGERIDLKWMLLSQSVVLMPPGPRFTSWFMEDSLEPYVHFVPIKADHSDVEAQIAWCERNLPTAERISERATLYVHDMLFGEESDKDNTEIRLRIMERYSQTFGG